MTMSSGRSTASDATARTMATSTPNRTNSRPVRQRLDRICCWRVIYESKETFGAVRAASSSSSKNSAGEKSPIFAMKTVGTVTCVALYRATVEL